jgi:hypothetical protein
MICPLINFEEGAPQRLYRFSPLRTGEGRVYPYRSIGTPITLPHSVQEPS